MDGENCKHACDPRRHPTATSTDWCLVHRRWETIRCVVLSDTESLQGGNWRGNEERSEIELRIATFFEDDTVSAQVKDKFTSQILLEREDAFQGWFLIRWAAISTPENIKWIPGFPKYWWIGAEHAGLTDAKHYLDRKKTDTSSNEPDCTSICIRGMMLQERKNWLTNRS